MKIVSWNCHYGLTETKFRNLIQVEDGKFADADVYAFQEVQENDFISFPDYHNAQNYKYRHWYGDHQEFGNCHEAREWEGDLGIAIISKLRFKRFDQGLMRFRYVVPYVFFDEANKEKFILIHVWTKSKPDGYFEPVYKALEFYKQLFPSLPIIMLGDFNFGVTFDDSFIKKFESRLSKEIDGIKIAHLVGKEQRSFYYPQYPEKKYFNDCIFVKDSKVQFEIGDSKLWIPEISDHCPIIGTIDL